MAHPENCLEEGVEGGPSGSLAQCNSWEFSVVQLLAPTSEPALILGVSGEVWGPG